MGRSESLAGGTPCELAAHRGKTCAVKAPCAGVSRAVAPNTPMTCCTVAFALATLALAA